jgi:Fur family ferric uptake transcriptional regulator
MLDHDEKSHPPCSGHSIDSALAILRTHGLRVTEPRKAILQTLLNEHGPYSADEIHKRLGHSGCDVVTVYRSLQAMEEIGTLRRCDFGDGVYRYEFNHGEHHHHHIICRSCRSVETIDVCVADSLERIARLKGYQKVTHTLEVFGICLNCSTKNSPNLKPDPTPPRRSTPQTPQSAQGEVLP